MMFDFVIARYRENIDWLNSLTGNPLINKIFVYNKSDTIQDLNGIINLKLDNVGRESHTYLYHVINNYSYLYENYNNFTLFFQGHPHFNLENLNEYLFFLKEKSANFTNNFLICSPDVHLEYGRRPTWGGDTSSSKYDIQNWARIYLNKYIDNNTIIPIYFGACFGVKNELILLSSILKYKAMITPELTTLNPEEAHYFERLWYYVFNIDQAYVFN